MNAPWSVPGGGRTRKLHAAYAAGTILNWGAVVNELWRVRLMQLPKREEKIGHIGNAG
jgi:hypothetical protein